MGMSWVDLHYTTGSKKEYVKREVEKVKNKNISDQDKINELENIIMILIGEKLSSL